MNVRPTDLVFFAGGESLDRFGVFVARTSPAEDNAETLTRAAPALYRDRTGTLRLASANIPRPEMLDPAGSGDYETSSLLLGSADVFSYPFVIRPRAITVYVYYEERNVGGGIVHIGSAGDSGARLDILDTAGTISVLHHNGTSSASSALAEQANLLDQVELLATLSDTGVVQIYRRINGGATETASASGALSLATDWADYLIYINSMGSASQGERAYRTVRIALGAYSMDDMAGTLTGAAAATRLYPAQDASGVWGWTEVSGEAEGIIDDSSGILGVDDATTIGGATVLDLNARILAVVTT